MARIEYRHLHIDWVEEGRKKRSLWLADSDGASQRSRALWPQDGSSGWRDLAPVFLAFLNELGSEGWRVVNFTPPNSVMSVSQFIWPEGHFLLAKES